MKRYFLLGLTCLIGIIGCSSQNQTLVTIADKNYTIGDFKERFQFAPTDDSLKRMEKVSEFINQMLLIEEARQRGYVDDPVVQSAYDTQRKDVIARGYYNEKVTKKINVSASEVRKVYEQVTDQYHLAQIVVESESLANFIEAQINLGVSFDSLLKFSLDTLSPHGDIGKLSVMQVPPEILETLKKTKVGGITDPLRFGKYFYCFKILEHEKAETPKFDDIREQIRSGLIREKASAEGEKFAKKLIEKAKIEYNDEGLAVLLKPDSLITEEDLGKWVVKKYDTSFVRVRTIRDAVRYQYQRSHIEPKMLIERVLFPDLLYDEALRDNAEKLSEVKKNLEKTLSSLLYQKIYSDEIIAKVKIDSSEVVEYFKGHSDEYKDQKFKDIYVSLKNKLRTEKMKSLREDLDNALQKKYRYEINKPALAKLLKEKT